MKDGDILDLFYEAMPDKLSIEDCANGVTIEFQCEGRKYSVDTSAGYRFRTRPIQQYYDLLDARVVRTVKETK